MATISATPKTTSPTSVFSWLIKNFGAEKCAFQNDSNPWASYIMKNCTIDAAGRKTLTKHLRTCPEWKEEQELYFTWQGLAIDLRKRTGYWAKHFEFSSPKKARPSTISYYD